MALQARKINAKDAHQALQAKDLETYLDVRWGRKEALRMRRQNCCRPQATGTRLPACSTRPLERTSACPCTSRCHRTPEEFATGHAPGAVNVPVQVYVAGQRQPNPDFVEQVTVCDLQARVGACGGWAPGQAHVRDQARCVLWARIKSMCTVRTAQQRETRHAGCKPPVP